MQLPSYASLAVFAAVAFAFPLAALGVARLWAWFLRRPAAGGSKTDTYECGVPPEGEAWIRFKPHYYLYAILFLIFDVEVVFLLPFGVAFTGLGTGAVLAMLVFILLLAEGLVWAWQREHLEWS
ncbi:NADH-quinone oxidoreductase subunit A [Nibricoccus sp. IMCC34717]|uniref:NADH-quinone oxidoreductase subunit A n=1 Tax=Nibricoccus sp. IMCC34717 TaxID=3034021 RepID=UPI00384C8F36